MRLEPQALASSLSSVFASAHYRPAVLPSVAMELVQISREPDVASPAVVKLLKNEQMLTAKLLTRGGRERQLPGKVTFEARAGDILSVRSPGGGGWGGISDESAA
jgi:hypothetical protein